MADETNRERALWTPLPDDYSLGGGRHGPGLKKHRRHAAWGANPGRSNLQIALPILLKS